MPLSRVAYQQDKGTTAQLGINNLNARAQIRVLYLCGLVLYSWRRPKFLKSKWQLIYLPLSRSDDIEEGLEAVELVDKPEVSDINYFLKCYGWTVH